MNKNKILLLKEYDHEFSTNLASEIIHTPLISKDAGETLGYSRENRPIKAFRFGSGGKNISLLAGCHADEPVGPRLLRHFISYLKSHPSQSPLLSKYSWWIVPHINPDGAFRNQSWYTDDDEVYDCERYLNSVIREKPGDDIEFGFPRNTEDHRARPETQAIYSWWHKANVPFHLHASLHGMAVASGPWFLLEKDWWPRCSKLKQMCEEKVCSMGYELHDVDRKGEKGFHRLAKGFCSRPDSVSMANYFLERKDKKMAAKFRPSSMETIRSLGGDPLTLVSEMPLFIVPREALNPDDSLRWKEKIHHWRQGNRKWATLKELKGMPVKDQMILQWTFISAGLLVVDSCS